MSVSVCRSHDLGGQSSSCWPRLVSTNFFKPASSSRRASSLAAVSAGEMGCGANRTQPAHNNTNETVGSQYFKMSNCHHMLRQQYCDRSLLSSPEATQMSRASW